MASKLNKVGKSGKIAQSSQRNNQPLILNRSREIHVYHNRY